MTDIDKHMEEYLDSKKMIKNELHKKTQSHPIEFSDFMKKSLIESKDNIKTFKDRLGLRLRRAHDYFGWMAKKDTRQSLELGECRGAIYRSQEYMKIPLQDRSGESLKKLKERGESYSSHHVHIEHSIPVNTILEYFWQYKDNLLETDEQKKLHETFLSISVCTALTRHEEESCIKEGLSKKHPEFEKGKILVNSLTDIHPFKRYSFSKRLKIYETITGSEINPEIFTLKDHINLINKVDIYDWDYISSRYPLL